MSESIARVHSSSSSFFNSDDIGGVIDEAKRKAASANGTAGDTLDRLNAIRKEIDKISVTPVDSNLSNILDDVDQSGEILNLSFFFLRLWYKITNFITMPFLPLVSYLQ